ncbi:MAG: AAA family ATPase [Candidatus Thiodiazotropha sp.]|nr:AAA family ATPase [Candidatus Thiodiazotropha sp.]
MEDGCRQLIVMCGTTGSGKSTVAELLSSQLGSPIFVADAVRRDLAGGKINGRMKYSKVMTRITYKNLMEGVEDEFMRGKDSIIVDGTFLRRWQRRLAKITANRCHAQLIVISCEATNPRKLGRLTKRRDTFSGPRQLRRRILIHHTRVYEKVLASEANKLFVVNNNRNKQYLSMRLSNISKLFPKADV